VLVLTRLVDDEELLDAAAALAHEVAAGPVRAMVRPAGWSGARQPTGWTSKDDEVRLITEPAADPRAGRVCAPSLRSGAGRPWRCSVDPDGGARHAFQVRMTLAPAATGSAPPSGRLDVLLPSPRVEAL
jgi:hypothetical protein